MPAEDPFNYNNPDKKVENSISSTEDFDSVTPEEVEDSFFHPTNTRETVFKVRDSILQLMELTPDPQKKTVRKLLGLIAHPDTQVSDQAVEQVILLTADTLT